jgi:NADH-quinone oxidoreductase subunit A
MHDYFGHYAVVGVLFLVGGGIVAAAMGANRLLRPDWPTADKLTTYECGIDPVEQGWAQSYVRYYVFAFLYVVFAADAVFLFPWATVFAAKAYGAVTLGEMFVFLAFLSAGLLYAWRKGVLSWV